MAPDSRTDRELWNERYRTGEYHHDGDAAQVLRRAHDWLPPGRALDVAAGAGRNALYLAEQGYRVDAVDIADEGLAIGRERASQRGLHVNWIQADLEEFPVPTDAYAVICMIGYYDVELLESLGSALVDGGILLYEHHLGPAAIADRGPQSEEFRAAPGEILAADLGLSVLAYREWTKPYEVDGTTEIDPRVTLIARNGLDGEAWYPPVRG